MHLVSTGRRENVWEWLAQSAVVTGEGCQAAGGQAGCAGAAVVKSVTSMAQRRQVLLYLQVCLQLFRVIICKPFSNWIGNIAVFGFNIV